MNINDDNVRIPLSSFLKLLTSDNVPVPKAMTIASKIYKEYNTRSTISQLSDAKLKAAGVDIREDRRHIMSAMRKLGYVARGQTLVGDKVPAPEIAVESWSQASGSPSTSSTKPNTVDLLTTPTRRKRKKPDDDNEFLPSGPSEEIDNLGNFDFGEILDEDALKENSTFINRAPVMMAWAMLVAECMHFSREEALSIASVYTEMNAVTRGVSLGIYNKNTNRGGEAAIDGSQPYVELMGRRPLYRTQAGQWRALTNGSPVPPGAAFSYICRSFRQTTPYIVGALKLLANSYPRQELNEKAWSLYTEFRPEVNEWGKRAEVHCNIILALRKKGLVPVQEVVPPRYHEKPMIENESYESKRHKPNEETQSRNAKILTLEEYESLLDQDTTFDNVDLNFA